MTFFGSSGIWSDNIYYRKFLSYFRRKPTKPPLSFCKPSAYCIKQDMYFREQALFRPYLALHKEPLRVSCKTISGDKHKKQRKSRPCGIQIKQCVKILQYLSLPRLTNLGVKLFYRLQMILFVFYVYRPMTSKNAKGIAEGLADFRRELVLVRKFDKTSANPRFEGFTCHRVFLRFSSKIT